MASLIEITVAEAQNAGTKALEQCIHEGISVINQAVQLRMKVPQRRWHPVWPWKETYFSTEHQARAWVIDMFEQGYSFIFKNGELFTFSGLNTYHSDLIERTDRLRRLLRSLEGRTATSRLYLSLEDLEDLA